MMSHELGGRKVKATLHWVFVPHALDAEVRRYDRLFATEDPEDVPEGGDPMDSLNPDSLEVVAAKVEPSLAGAETGHRCQFERLGYFVVDPDTTPDRLVFNRTATLRDRWANADGRVRHHVLCRRDACGGGCEAASVSTGRGGRA